MFARAQHAYPKRRLLTALLGLVLLLAGHVPIAAFTAANDMSCCQDGHSCCRRAHHHAAHSENGPQLRSQNCSQGGCCIHPGTAAIAIHSGAEPANLAYTADLEWHAQAVSRPTLSRRYLTTNIFQRPPPYFA
ncbi:MAG TPA: hypothetical protein VGK64_21895 [Bryobacteraceae bacterium]